MSSKIPGLIANLVASNPIWSPRIRPLILRMLGSKIDRKVRIYPFVRFVNQLNEISIGEGTFINQGVLFGSNEKITIGRQVSIGPNVMIMPTTHLMGPKCNRAGGGLEAAPIRIEDGVWIGAGAIILSGVTITSGSVIAAGAVVTKNCDSEGLYAGVPATLKRGF